MAQVWFFGLSNAAIVWAFVVGIVLARFTAYVWRTWPRQDPTDDTLWERRHG